MCVCVRTRTEESQGALFDHHLSLPTTVIAAVMVGGQFGGGAVQERGVIQESRRCSAQCVRPDI